MSPAFAGPPGVYFESAAPLVAFALERMDVCAFVGVSPRGPSRVPVADDETMRGRPLVDPARRHRRSVAVAVESFDEYRRHYGGFEGAGLLPYAVRTFFEQGGRRAYVVRIVHQYGDGRDRGGVAHGTLPGITAAGAGVELHARDEGEWGNALTANVAFSVRPIGFDEARSSIAELVLPADALLPAGSMLRVTLAPGIRRLTAVSAVRLVPQEDRPGRELRATLVSPLPSAATAAEVVDATLTIDDGAGGHEVHEGLGLHPEHPRFIATVVSQESELAYPDPAWADIDLAPLDERLLVGVASHPQFRDGADRSSDIVPDDFFDAGWTLGNDEPGDGVHALVQLTDLAMVCAPDLYSPTPLPPVESIVDPPSVAGPEFSPCVDVKAGEQTAAAPPLGGLSLDPLMPADLARISAYQRQLVELADTLRTFTVLLDVPPGLRPPQILRWRRQFSSAFAAAYHPWISVAPPDDLRDALVRIPPSAVAAGIVAAQELRFGVPHGPANMIAHGAVALDRLVTAGDHAALHAAGINVYVRDPGGFRLTTARTLSSDGRYRQLSVRRLITQLARTLERQTQWIVFEPNTAALRGDLTRALRALLRELFAANAFAGDAEEEAFFVRCDDELNDWRSIDSGCLVAEIGVAPAEPLEFIIVRFVRDLDGRITVEA